MVRQWMLRPSQWISPYINDAMTEMRHSTHSTRVAVALALGKLTQDEAAALDVAMAEDHPDSAVPLSLLGVGGERKQLESPEMAEARRLHESRPSFVVGGEAGAPSAEPATVVPEVVQERIAREATQAAPEPSPLLPALEPQAQPPRTVTNMVANPAMLSIMDQYKPLPVVEHGRIADAPTLSAEMLRRQNVPEPASFDYTRAPLPPEVVAAKIGRAHV